MPIDVVQHFKGLTSNEDRVATAVAAIQTLTTVLQEHCDYDYVLGQDIRSAAEELTGCESKIIDTAQSGLRLFLRYVTRMFGMEILMLQEGAN